MIKENETDGKLYKEIMNIIYDDKRSAELSESIKQFADPDSANKIAEEAIKLIKK